MKGRNATRSVIAHGSFATSAIARYTIGGAACCINQDNGNVIDGGGVAATETGGGTVGLGLEGCEGGRVTKSLYAGLKYRLGSLLWMAPRLAVRIAVLSLCARGR